jgi:hypothetical protein
VDLPGRAPAPPAAPAGGAVAPEGGPRGARGDGSPRNRGGQGGSSPRGIRGQGGSPPRGIFFLAGAGLAFTAAQLLFVSPRMGLSWDESVYVSQVSGHAPAAWFDPARARGVPLLVAPVAALTSSVAALRVYLAIASGLGLTLALWAWRPLRPAWVLGLAGVTFGGLWVAQYYGPQAMPDMWSALGSLAAVGCFARLVGGGRAAGGHGAGGRGALAGVGISVAFVTLIRPGDAVYLAGPLLIFGGWLRRWTLTAVIGAGLLAGGAEWVIEAYLRFGGIASRLHAAAAEQGGFGLHFALVDELRALNGPTLCRPCTIGVRTPELDLWWLVLPVLVAVGIVAARRAGQLTSALLAAGCGLCLAAQYLFMIDYAAPRFLLPAYALLAIGVADGLAFAITGVSSDLRPAMTAIVTCFLVLQLFTQHLVLDHEAGGTVTFHDDYTRIAAELAARGIRPPCLIQGVQYIPIALAAGCASAGNAAPGEPVAVLVQVRGHPPSYARNWRSYRITGTTILKVNAYVRG